MNGYILISQKNIAKQIPIIFPIKICKSITYITEPGQI